MKKFNKLTSNAKEVKKEERINFLNKLEDSVREIHSTINQEIAKGNLSKLCNLNDSFCWAEYLDVYLDNYRNENNISYDLTNYEVVEMLKDNEFIELIKTIKECIEQETDEYKNLFEE